MERAKAAATDKRSGSSGGGGIVGQLAAVQRGLEAVAVALMVTDATQQLHGVGEPELVEDGSSGPSVGAGEPINEDQVELDCCVIWSAA